MVDVPQKQAGVLIIMIGEFGMGYRIVVNGRRTCGFIVASQFSNDYTQ